LSFYFPFPFVSSADGSICFGFLTMNLQPGFLYVCKESSWEGSLFVSLM
jgi:hypothetical protein